MTADESDTADTARGHLSRRDFLGTTTAAGAIAGLPASVFSTTTAATAAGAAGQKIVQQPLLALALHVFNQRDTMPYSVHELIKEEWGNFSNFRPAIISAAGEFLNSGSQGLLNFQTRIAGAVFRESTMAHGLDLVFQAAHAEGTPLQALFSGAQGLRLNTDHSTILQNEDRIHAQMIEAANAAGIPDRVYLNSPRTLSSWLNSLTHGNPRSDQTPAEEIAALQKQLLAEANRVIRSHYASNPRCDEIAQAMEQTITDGFKAAEARLQKTLEEGKQQIDDAERVRALSDEERKRLELLQALYPERAGFFRKSFMLSREADRPTINSSWER